jgi:DNA-binding NarL/FixJ family response regulator
MIPMHPHLISQLIADRQAGLMASARQQRLARQARAARRARPGQRGRAAPMLAALGRLAWRRSSPRTIQAPAAGPGQAAPTLTPRELGLLKLAAQRLTNPGIAQQLVLSEHTVHRHLASILCKRSLSSRAAAWGVRTGLVRELRTATL